MRDRFHWARLLAFEYFDRTGCHGSEQRQNEEHRKGTTGGEPLIISNRSEFPIGTGASVRPYQARVSSLLIPRLGLGYRPRVRAPL
jgi:hypothetical protein